jgi:mannose-6-phosphate isomerase class I
VDELRKTTQPVAPLQKERTTAGEYDIYPGYNVGEGKIATGFDALTQAFSDHRNVVLDGYVGVRWNDFRRQLNKALTDRGVVANWIAVEVAMRPEEEIERLVEPFLGGEDPIFGTRFTGELIDFFDSKKLETLRPDPAATVNILYGSGASLAGWSGFLAYVDLPKNEIQFRARAGSIYNLGAGTPKPHKVMYKRFYFVDWVVLNRHKAQLLPAIDLIIDGQRPEMPALMIGDNMRAALSEMSHRYFRVRPWFEPGPWGGQWIKKTIPRLPQDVPNYAWSFELIVPENGLMLESDGRLLEFSFDFLMYCCHKAVLGDYADRFGYEFPIRFDFLDTVDGGNLSLQCHPRPAFIREHFGETFTQDETYYILHASEDASVYLGFQEDIDPDEFRAKLEWSREEGAPVEVEKYVQVHPARKHDLFLIPTGTIHCSGEGNLVLEISATPYIFTFKMYDWLRLDLEGRPRPLNIDRAFANLCFDYKGRVVKEALISKPRVIEKGQGWRLVHLATHPEHFYDVHRFDFREEVTEETDGSPHVMSLVEGDSITLETAGGHHQRFGFAETFVVPAAAGSYRLINEGNGVARVVKAFLKPAWFEKEEHDWLRSQELPHRLNPRGAMAGEDAL